MMNLSLRLLPGAAAAALLIFSLNLSLTATERDVDGNGVTLNPPSGVSLVIYTNGDLGDLTRALTKALDQLRPRSDFQLVRIIDLRGEVAPAVRKLVTKKIRGELDKEAARLKPIYAKAGNHADPRQEMRAIADFSGSTLGKLKWGGYSVDLRAVIFKNGAEVKRFDKSSPSEVEAYVMSLVNGGNGTASAQ
jgi:hypothetical protein